MSIVAPTKRMNAKKLHFDRRLNNFSFVIICSHYFLGYIIGYKTTKFTYFNLYLVATPLLPLGVKIGNFEFEEIRKEIGM